MTVIENLQPRVQYTYSTASQLYNITFPYIERQYVKCMVRDQVLEYNTHYQVPVFDPVSLDEDELYLNLLITPNADLNDGVTIEDGDLITIYRETPIDQQAEFPQTAKFSSQKITEALDKLTLLIQELDDTLSSCVRLSKEAPIDFNVMLPIPTANQVLQWNAEGTQLINYDLRGEITEYKEDLDDAFDEYTSDLNTAFDDYKSEVNSTISTYKDDIEDAFDDYKEDLEDDLETYKETVNSSISDISDTASSAVSTANTASTKADTAISTANTASTNASAAVSTANTASTNASSALSTANSAASTADTASTTASTALSTANSALSTAETAASNASTALTNSQSAVSTAESAASTASTAATNAATAISTANGAATDAATAISTANTAASNASSAVSTANTAASNASTALTNSASAVETAEATSAQVEEFGEDIESVLEAAVKINELEEAVATAVSSSEDAVEAASAATTAATNATTAANNATAAAQAATQAAASFTVDSALSSTSENPVQNKVIYNALQNVEIDVDSTLSSTSENPVQNKVIYTALGEKQDELVSGTNIKTINNNSLLGSGNISLQATLVSGVNIRTINNTSLLGYGDIDTKQIFIATYNTTTYNKISTAYNAGKIIFVVDNTTNRTYSLNYFIGSPSNIFKFSSYESGKQYICTISATSGWVQTSITLEETSYKVTSISSSSTNTQYPSAKCVWDNTLHSVSYNSSNQTLTIS